ncbi:TRAP transporter substrate-binding protein [Pseudomonas mangiferae]|uniref:TRAP transporter substrate-binding protein n=1 Tax=Pseudomonas mangiferae TaxID=2593654 RepID=A0A553GTK8_9PSED|nr:TRAP transporter substrate-binding protein [Pseudomonas mangiferae]TRX72823.1 TRAP transporter substrate-binding protein [Pseudomonas mangiferae]
MKKFAQRVCSLLVAGSLSLSAMAADYTLKISHSAQPGEPYHLGLQTFVERLQTLTDGRVDAILYPNSQLGNEKAVTEGLLLGTVDIAVSANGVLYNFEPSVGIFDLPYLFPDRARFHAALDGPVGEQLKEKVAARGFHILAYYDAGIRHLLTKRPVNAIGDLAGMKIRTIQVPAHIAAWKAFGANPTPMNYDELYGALETGVVDGAEAANSNYYAQKFYEVAPNYAQVAWTALVAELLISEKRLKSFPEDIQQAILQAAQESAEVERKAYAEADVALLAKLQEAGVNVTYPDLAPFREAARGIQAAFAKTPEQRAQLELLTGDH